MIENEIKINDKRTSVLIKAIGKMWIKVGKSVGCKGLECID